MSQMSGVTVFHIRPGFRCSRTVSTAEKLSANLHAMANDFAPTMFTDWCHQLDSALKAIEDVPHTCLYDFEALVIVISTDFTLCHSSPSRGRCISISRESKRPEIGCPRRWPKMLLVSSSVFAGSAKPPSVTFQHRIQSGETNGNRQVAARKERKAQANRHS